VTYAVNIEDLWRRAADCVDELLRGAKVADVPICQASTFQLVINSARHQFQGRPESRFNGPLIVGVACRRGDRIGFYLLRCMSLLVAQRVISVRCRTWSLSGQ